jgi:hypothetical protein
MMRPASYGVLSALFVATAGFVPARAADGDKDVKAIIAKAIEARGGAANLDKYKASISNFKANIAAGGMEVTMTGTTKDQIPDKLRIDATMNIGGQNLKFQQVINGDKGWQGINGMNMDMGKEELAEEREGFHAGQIADLRGLNAKGVKLSPLSDTTVDGKAAVGVKVSSDGYRDVALYFDKASGQLLKSETKGKEPGPGKDEFKAETFYSDYKNVSGVNTPHKVKVLRDGKPFMTMEMSSVELLEKLDDKEFAKP